jgi:pimeloyl-ACP methyl ester carboxylesterase
MLNYFRAFAGFVFILLLPSMSYAFSGLGDDCTGCRDMVEINTDGTPDEGTDNADQTASGYVTPTDTPGASGCDPIPVPFPFPDTDPDAEPPTNIPLPTCDRACYYDVQGFGLIAFARIFYPCEMQEGVLYGATTLSGGWTNIKENLYWLANKLALRNIIVFAVSSRNNLTVSGYEQAQTDAIDKIKAENSRRGSPVRGKIGAIGLTGFAMGGGAALNVSNASVEDVAIAVAIAPYGAESDLSRIDCPVLIITGTNDEIVPPAENSEPAYQSLPGDIPKAYATLPDYRHLYWMSYGGSQGNDTSKLIAAWLRWAFYDDSASFSIVKNPPGQISYDLKSGF